MRRIVIAVSMMLSIGIASQVFAQNPFIVQIKTDDRIAPHTIVSINKGNAEPASEVADIFGVVVRDSDALIAIESSENSLFITEKGNTLILFSTINGVAKKGDPLTLSPDAGVAMKASTDDTVIAVANADFDVEQENTIMKSNSSNEEYVVGTLDARLEFSKLGTSAGAGTVLGRVFGVFKDGSNTTIAKIVASTAIVLTALLFGGILLSTTIRSGITAIGRNPLSTKDIVRTIWKLLLAAIAMAALGSAAVYLLITY